MPHADTPQTISIENCPPPSRTLLRDEHGSETLEVAISCLVVFLVLLGIMECSRAIYIEHFLDSVAQSASRYAMVRGSSWSGVACTSATTLDCDATSTDVSRFVQSTASQGIVSGSLVTTTTWTGLSAAGTVCDTSLGANSPGCAVQIKVTYPFKFLLPFANRASIQLNSSAAVTIAQ